MKINREGEKVMILRNKRGGLRLVIREDELPCQYNCYLWNHFWCKKNHVESWDYMEVIILLKTDES